jgi:hypothetical protein
MTTKRTKRMASYELSPETLQSIEDLHWKLQKPRWEVIAYAVETLQAKCQSNGKAPDNITISPHMTVCPETGNPLSESMAWNEENIPHQQ